MRFTLLAAVLLALVMGCDQSAEKTAEKTAPVSNNNFNVELLFTDQDGYKVYRFRDGEDRYYVTGPGNLRAMSSHSESDGNTSSTVHDDIATSR
jgi:hypothetical protein